MAAFNLTAQLQLQAPNTKNVANQIQRDLSNIKLNIDVGKNAKNLATVQQNLGSVAKEGDRASKSFNLLGRNVAEAARRFSVITVATGSFISLARGIKTSVGSAIEFERELVKISQVTGKTLDQLQGLQGEVTRLSTSLGVANADLLQTSRVLAQAGLSALKTKQALEVLAQTTLAPTFDTIIDTTEGAIAILNQFGRQAAKTGNDIKFLEQSLDAINAVSKTFAVESSDLIATVRRTGGVFEAAGGNLKELIALFTSVRQTTREGAETIATGFRTIFTRLQRKDTIDALNELGISLQDAEGKFVGPLKAIEKLAIGLSGLDPKDVRFNEIVEQLGGFRQIGKVIPLIKQFEVTQRALAVANNSVGSTSKDAQDAQKALSVQLTKTRESFDALIRKFTASDTFQDSAKFVLKLANTFLKFAQSLETVLPLLTKIAAIKLGRSLAPGLLQIFGRGTQRRNAGGKILGFNRGGFVPGQGNGDTVPAMLEPGEFVIRKNSAKEIGASRLQAMNSGGSGVKRAKGGYIPRAKRFSGGGGVGILDTDQIADKTEANSIRDAIIQGKNIKQLVWGPAGSGKTTLARKIYGENFVKSKSDLEKYNDFVVLSGAQTTKKSTKVSGKGEVPFSQTTVDLVRAAKAITAVIPDQETLTARRDKRVEMAEETQAGGDTRSVGQLKASRYAANEEESKKILELFRTFKRKATEVSLIQPTQENPEPEAQKLNAGGNVNDFSKSRKFVEDINTTYRKPADQEFNQTGEGGRKATRFNAGDEFSFTRQKNKEINVNEIDQRIAGVRQYKQAVKAKNAQERGFAFERVAESLLGITLEKDASNSRIDATGPGGQRYEIKSITRGGETADFSNRGLGEKLVGAAIDPVTKTDERVKKQFTSQKLTGNPDGDDINLGRITLVQDVTDMEELSKVTNKDGTRRKNAALGGLIQKFALGGIAQKSKVGAAILDPDMGVGAESVSVGINDVKPYIKKSTEKQVSGLSKEYTARKYSIVKQGLNQKTSDAFKDTLLDGAAKGVNDAVAGLGSDLGLGSVTPDPSDITLLKDQIRSSGALGGPFENALNLLSNKGRFKPAPQNAPFDFPQGLSGAVADNYDNLPNAFVDAKSSYAAAETAGLKGKIAQEIAAEYVNSSTYKSLAADTGSGDKAGLEKALRARFPKRSDRAGYSLSDFQTATGRKYKASELKELGFTKVGGTKYLNKGGSANGPAPSDTVPAMLTPGEFVFSKKAAESIGYGRLNKMNKKGVEGFASGGAVGLTRFGKPVQKLVAGGTVERGLDAIGGGNAQTRAIAEALYVDAVSEGQTVFEALNSTASKLNDYMQKVGGTYQEAIKANEQATAALDQSTPEQTRLNAQVRARADAEGQVRTIAARALKLQRKGIGVQKSFQDATIDVTTEQGKSLKTLEELQKSATALVVERKAAKDALRRGYSNIGGPEDPRAGTRGGPDGPGGGGDLPDSLEDLADSAKEAQSANEKQAKKISDLGQKFNRVSDAALAISFAGGTLVESFGNITEQQKVQYQAVLNTISANIALTGQIASLGFEVASQLSTSALLNRSALQTSAALDKLAGSANVASSAQDGGGKGAAAGKALGVLAVGFLAGSVVSAVVKGITEGYKAVEKLQLETANKAADKQLDALEAGRGASEKDFVKARQKAAGADLNIQRLSEQGAAGSSAGFKAAAGVGIAGAAVSAAASIGATAAAAGALTGSLATAAVAVNAIPVAGQILAVGLAAAAVAAGVATIAFNAAAESEKEQAEVNELLAKTSRNYSLTQFRSIKAAKALTDNLQSAADAGASASAKIGILASATDNAQSEIADNASRLTEATKQEAELRKKLIEQGVITEGGSVSSDADTDDDVIKDQIKTLEELTKQRESAEKANIDLINKTAQQAAVFRTLAQKVVSEGLTEISKLGPAALANVNGLNGLAKVSPGLSRAITIAQNKFEELKNLELKQALEGEDDEGVKNALRRKAEAEIAQSQIELVKSAEEQVLAQQRVARAALLTEQAERQKALTLLKVNKNLSAFNLLLLQSDRLSGLYDAIEDAGKNGGFGAVTFDTSIFDVTFKQLNEKAIERINTLGKGAVGDDATGFAKNIRDVKKISKGLPAVFESFRRSGKGLEIIDIPTLKKQLSNQIAKDIPGGLSGLGGDIRAIIEKNAEEAIGDGIKGSLSFESQQKLNEELENAIQNQIEVFKRGVEIQNQFLQKLADIDAKIISAQEKIIDAQAKVSDAFERNADRLARASKKDRSRLEKEAGRLRTANIKLGDTARGAGARAGDVKATAKAFTDLTSQSQQLRRQQRDLAKTATADPKNAQKIADLGRQANDAAQGAARARAELERLADQSARAADIEKDLSELRERRSEAEGLRESIAFGGDQERVEIIKGFALLNQAINQGSIAGATGDQRQLIAKSLDSVSSQLINFEGQQVTGKELKQIFAARETGRLGLGGLNQFIENLRKAENPLLSELKDVAKTELLATAALAGIESQSLNVLKDIRTALVGAFPEELDKAQADAAQDLGAGEEDAQIGIAKNQGILVKLNSTIADQTRRVADLTEQLAIKADVSIGAIRDLDRKREEARDKEDKAQNKSRGGPVYMNRGGVVPSSASTPDGMEEVFKPKGTDTVPAMLQKGEFVIKKSSVDKIGKDNLQQMNNGGTVYAAGGFDLSGFSPASKLPSQNPKRRFDASELTGIEKAKVSTGELSANGANERKVAAFQELFSDVGGFLSGESGEDFAKRRAELQRQTGYAVARDSAIRGEQKKNSKFNVIQKAVTRENVLADLPVTGQILGATDIVTTAGKNVLTGGDYDAELVGSAARFGGSFINIPGLKYAGKAANKFLSTGVGKTLKQKGLNVAAAGLLSGSAETVIGTGQRALKSKTGQFGAKFVSAKVQKDANLSAPVTGIAAAETEEALKRAKGGAVYLFAGGDAMTSFFLSLEEIDSIRAQQEEGRSDFVSSSAVVSTLRGEAAEPNPEIVKRNKGIIAGSAKSPEDKGVYFEGPKDEAEFEERERKLNETIVKEEEQARQREARAKDTAYRELVNQGKAEEAANQYPNIDAKYKEQERRQDQSLSESTYNQLVRDRQRQAAVKQNYDRGLFYPMLDRVDVEKRRVDSLEVDTSDLDKEFKNPKTGEFYTAKERREIQARKDAEAQKKYKEETKRSQQTSDNDQERFEASQTERQRKMDEAYARDQAKDEEIRRLNAEFRPNFEKEKALDERTQKILNDSNNGISEEEAKKVAESELRVIELQNQTITMPDGSTRKLTSSEISDQIAQEATQATYTDRQLETIGRLPSSGFFGSDAATDAIMQNGLDVKFDNEGVLVPRDAPNEPVTPKSLEPRFGDVKAKEKYDAQQAKRKEIYKDPKTGAVYKNKEAAEAAERAAVSKELLAPFEESQRAEQREKALDERTQKILNDSVFAGSKYNGISEEKAKKVAESELRAEKQEEAGRRRAERKAYVAARKAGFKGNIDEWRKAKRPAGPAKRPAKRPAGPAAPAAPAGAAPAGAAPAVPPKVEAQAQQEEKKQDLRLEKIKQSDRYKKIVSNTGQEAADAYARKQLRIREDLTEDGTEQGFSQAKYNRLLRTNGPAVANRYARTKGKTSNEAKNKNQAGKKAPQGQENIIKLLFNLLKGAGVNPADFLKQAQGFNNGGGTQDTIPAMLTPGEFVVNPKSAQKIGMKNLKEMNENGVMPQKFAKGGVVGGMKTSYLSDGGNGSGGMGPLEINTGPLTEVFDKFSAAFGSRLDNILGQFDFIAGAVDNLATAINNGMKISHSFSGDMTMTFNLGEEQVSNIVSAVGNAMTPKIEEIIKKEVDQKFNKNSFKAGG